MSSETLANRKNPINERTLRTIILTFAFLHVSRSLPCRALSYQPHFMNRIAFRAHSKIRANVNNLWDSQTKHNQNNNRARKPSMKRISTLMSSASATEKNDVSSATKEPRPLVIVIAGPTAVGKSAVAASLCRPDRSTLLPGKTRSRGHILSADSVQAYEGVFIGANKPTKEEIEATPHYLVDVVPPDGQYTAGDWMGDALEIIGELTGNETRVGVEGENEQNKRSRMTSSVKPPNDETILPVVVGGTMMYLQWLVHGKPDAIRPSPEAVQKATELVQNLQSKDIPWEETLSSASLDDLPLKFKTRILNIGQNDWYRFRRTLEVAYSGYDDLEDLYSGERDGGLLSSGYDVRCFFLCPDDRMNHTALIDRRCEDMLTRGLISETADLSLSGRLPDDGQPARAIGYRQVLDYLRRPEPLKGDVQKLSDFIDNFKTATRRYAKKQMQWFRRDKAFFFVPVPLEDNPKNRVEGAADFILSMCLLNEDEYHKVLMADDSISAQTKQTNEDQGKNMKFYMGRRYKILEGSVEHEQVLSEAEKCTDLMQDLVSPK